MGQCFIGQEGILYCIHKKIAFLPGSNKFYSFQTFMQPNDANFLSKSGQQIKMTTSQCFLPSSEIGLTGVLEVVQVWLRCGNTAISCIIFLMTRKHKIFIFIHVDGLTNLYTPQKLFPSVQQILQLHVTNVRCPCRAASCFSFCFCFLICIP